MGTWEPYDDAKAKVICYGCGSRVSRQSYNYFRKMIHQSGNKIWSEIYEGRAMYFALRCRTHCRLVEIAVLEGHQGKGLGRKVLFRLLARMKAEGITRLTFRTPMDEGAQHFWLHVGARIMDVKGKDFVMELNIR